MADSNLPLSELLKIEFSDAFLGDLARIVSHHYGETLEEARGNYQEPEVPGVWRGNRRGKIEGSARSVATRHGVPARVEKNRSDDPHTVIDSEHFIFTISHVDSVSTIPRAAQFRQELAVRNTPLFDMIEPIESIEGKKFNAILIYGPSVRDPFRLGFVAIRFPSPTSSRWLEDCLDLSRYCSDISIEEAFTVEDVPAPEEPQIRTDQDKREEI